MSTGAEITPFALVLRDEGARPWTINKVGQTKSRYKWANHTKQVRARWAAIGMQAHVATCCLERIAITVTPLHVDKRSPQDVAACAAEFKPALDGLVDAGLLPDDGPQWVASVTFVAPRICGVNGMEILITEQPREQAA